MTYPVSEDTLFLKKNLHNMKPEGKTFLEVGTGSGEIALEASRLGADVTAVDNNPEAVEKARKRADEEELDLEIFQSDLLEKVENQFDLIVFNPPYLPGRRESDADPLLGGEKGVELTEEFLREATRYLSDQGEVYFIGSSLADLEELERKFELEKVDEKRLWFETLYLYRLSA